MCGGCSGQFAVEQQVAPAGRSPIWLCPRCAAAERRAEAVTPVMAGRLCRHVDYPRGPFADLVITRVDGEYVEVHALGFPDLGGHDGRMRYHRSEVTMKARIF